MSTVRYFVALLLCGTSLLCAGWFFSLVHNADHISPQVHVNRVLASLFFLVVGGLLLWLSEHFSKSVKWLSQAPDRRPVVRVWTHNGDTVITTDEVYRLSLRLREESLKAYLLSNPDRIKVWPFLYTYHSKTRCYNGISQNELKAILDSCSVQKTEMGVPMGNDTCYDIGFERMWRLLHGPNAKLPVT